MKKELKEKYTNLERKNNSINLAKEEIEKAIELGLEVM